MKAARFHAGRGLASGPIGSTAAARRPAILLAAIASGVIACLLPTTARAEHPIYAQLAGGLALFPGESPFDTGATFGLAGGWRASTLLALELGYQGAVFTEAAPVGRAAVAAVEHGGYFALLGSPFALVVSPYALAGVEVSHRRVAGDEPVSSIRPGTFVRLPLGAGADVRLGLFTLGLRATYLLSLREGREGGTGRAGDRIDVTLRIGANF